MPNLINWSHSLQLEKFPEDLSTIFETAIALIDGQTDKPTNRDIYVTSFVEVKITDLTANADSKLLFIKTVRLTGKVFPMFPLQYLFH